MKINMITILKASIGTILAIATILTCQPWVHRCLIRLYKESPKKDQSPSFATIYLETIWLYFAIPISIVISGANVFLIASEKAKAFLFLSEFMTEEPYQFPGGVEHAIMPEVSETLISLIMGSILLVCISRLAGWLSSRLLKTLLVFLSLIFLSCFLIVGLIDVRYLGLLSNFLLGKTYYPWLTLRYVLMASAAGLITESIIYIRKNRRMRSWNRFNS